MRLGKTTSTLVFSGHRRNTAPPISIDNPIDGDDATEIQISLFREGDFARMTALAEALGYKTADEFVQSYLKFAFNKSKHVESVERTRSQFLKECAERCHKDIYEVLSELDEQDRLGLLDTRDGGFDDIEEWSPEKDDEEDGEFA